MVKINIAADCGNAPKRLFLKDLSVAFIEGDKDFIEERITDDVTWNLVGDWEIEGKEKFLEGVDALYQTKDVAEMTLHKVITHGREGAMNGDVVLKDGKSYAFCHVVAFRSAKGNDIKEMTSFIIAK